MADITDLTPLATSTPEEAAKNIADAATIEVSPSAYKDYKPEFQPKIDQLRKPAEASDTTREFMQKSTEHTALASQDTERLSYIDRVINGAGEMFIDKPSREARLINLSNKKMLSRDQFTDDDQIELDNLNFNINEIEKRNYGIKNPVEQPNPEMFSNFADMADGAMKLLGQVPDSLVGSYRTMAEGAGRFTQVKEHPLLAAISKLPFAGPGLAMSAGATAAMFEQSTGSTYNTLSNMTDDQGRPLDIDETTKRNISLGVGVVTQALETIGGHALLKPAMPFLMKFTNPAMLSRELINAPEQLALRKTLTALGEAMATEGATESAQEVASIVGEEIGRSTKGEGIVDAFGSEAEFMDSLTRVTPKVLDYVSRTAQSGAVGALAGGATAVPAAAVGHQAMRSAFKEASDIEVNKKLQAFNPDRPLNLVEESAVSQSVKVLQIKVAMENAGKVGKSSKMYQLSPGELSNFTQMAFQKAGIEKVWVDFNEWRNKETDPAKIEEAKRLMGVPESVINAPSPVSAHKFLEYSLENPDVLDQMKMTPDGPSATQAEQFVTRMNEMNDKRSKLLSDLGIKESDLVTTDKKVIEANFKKPPLEPSNIIGRAEILLNDLKKPDLTEGERLVIDGELKKLRAETIKNFTVDGRPGDLIVADWSTPVDEKAIQVEGDFLKSQTYTESIRSVVPEPEQKKFDAAVTKARTDYLEGVREAASLELNKMLDVNYEIALEEQRQEEMERIKNSPEFALVSKFMQDRVTEGKKKKPMSLYAMDPAKLTDEQLMRYSGDERLKKIGAFKKDGYTAEQAARLIGAPSGDELLRVLAHYPTPAEIVEARTAAHEAELKQQTLDNTPISHAKILRALTDESKIAFETMNYLKSKEWSATKGAIKRIALPMPRIAELQHNAYVATQKTPIGDLNVRQFRVGQKKSQREAVTAILKTEPAKAFRAKEQEIINIEMQKAQHTAIGQANRVIKFAKRFKEKDTIATLKEAGQSYLDAANEIFDVFNLDPRAKGTSEAGAFAAWAKEQYELGNGDFSVPEYASDLRTSVNAMPVEQLLAIGDRLRAVLHSAKEKNKLTRMDAKLEKQWEMDDLRAEINDDLANRKGYDTKKLPPVQDHSVTDRYRLRKLWNSMTTLISNMEFVLKELDQDKNSGYYQELLMHPLKGDGKFYEKTGNSLRFKYTKALKEFVQEHIDAYGEKDYYQLGSKFLDIPEFRNSPAFNNGKLTKADLIVLWIYGGDPDGFRKRSANSGVSNEAIQTVLDRELEERDVVLGQRMIVDGLKTYRAATEQLQKETGGQEVTFIQGIPNTHKGKTYAGGYVPNKHKIDFDLTYAERTEELLKGKGDPFKTQYDARQYAAEQTEQGRLEERVGSTKPLDLSFTRMLRSHEEVIHDLSYRKPVMDALKVLKDPEIRRDMIATVGPAKYSVMVNSVVEIASRMDSENKNYFADQTQFLKDASRRMQSNFSVAVLGLNPTSVMIQGTSIGQAMQNMGVTGVKHLAVINARLMKNPHMVAGFYKFAVELDPTIGHFLEGLQTKIVSDIMELAPGGRKDGALGLAQQTHEWAVNASMSFMGGADMTIKTLIALASYEQFMAGDVENYSLDRVQGMSEADRHAAAQAYVGQISRTSLTHAQNEDKAPFQKNPLGATMTNYWNDARNVINNQVTQGRKAKRYGGEAIDAAKAGDKKLALKKSSYAAGAIITTIMISAMTRYLDDALHDRQVPDFDFSTPKGIANASQYLFTSPMVLGMEMTPWVRDVKYAATQGRSAIKKANLPITSMMSDLATTANAVNDLLIGKRDLSHLSKGQVAAMLRSESVLFIPIPVGGPRKILKWLGKPDKPKVGELDRTRVAIQEYKADPPAGTSDKFMKDLNAFEKSITPSYKEQ